MGIQEEGIEAEQWLINYFRKKGVKCFQPDCISNEDDKYVLNEIKHQEYFKAPPFDGHGLPRWQVEARLSFYKFTGIRCRLVVREKNSDYVYYQWLDDLEKSNPPPYDTNGAKPRRIYPLTAFNRFVCKN